MFFSDPTVSLIVEVIVKSSILLLFAVALDLFLKRVRASVKHIIWLLTFVMLLAIPIYSFLAPRVPLNLVQVDMPLAYEIDPAPLGINVPQDTGESGSFLFAYSIFSVSVYLSIAAIIFGWCARGYIAAHHISRKAVALNDERTRLLVARIRETIDLRSGPRVTTNKHLHLPATYGIFRPVIMLPESATSWSDERLYSVLIHEMAHIKRRDLVSRLLAIAGCALHWYNPFSWFGLHRLLMQQEFACDAFVMRQGVKKSGYALNLLELADIRPGRFISAMADFSDKKLLKNRVMEILEPKAEISRLGTWSLGLLILAALPLLVSLLAFSPFQESYTGFFNSDLEDARRFFHDGITPQHQELLSIENDTEYLDAIMMAMRQPRLFNKSENEAHLARLRSIQSGYLSVDRGRAQWVSYLANLLLSKYKKNLYRYEQFYDVLGAPANR